MGISISNLKQRLQTNPVRGFSLVKKTADLQVASLTALPQPLQNRIVGKISDAVQKDLEIKPSEILWDNRAKQAILVSPGFLDKLGQGLDVAMKVLPEDIILVLDSESNKLYFLAEKGNKSKVKGIPRTREGIIILTPEEAKKQMPPIGAMVEIPGGRYTLGDNKSEYDGEKPEHIVEVDPFLIDVFSRTNTQFKEAVDDGLYRQERFWTAQGWRVKESQKWTQPRFWGDENDRRFNGDNQPVVGVSHYESLAYLIWRSVQEGIDVKTFLTGGFFDLSKIYDGTTRRWIWPGYRLPTEAEIEIAIRGGLVGEEYPWKKGLGASAHFGQSQEEGATVDVNDPGFPPNGYGLRHAVGNNWIWGFDRYDKDYYKQLQEMGIVKNPIGPESGGWRIIRGGAWLYSADSLRVANRSNIDPDERYDSNGFRAARTP